MANNKKVLDSIKTFLERMKACDESIPEELADDALEMVEGVKDALCEDEEADVLEVTRDADEDLDKKIEDTFVKVMRKYGMIADKSMKSLDECMEAEVKDEDEVDLIEETKDEDPDDKDTKDSANEIRKYIASIKPIIASIPNARDRKRMSDTIASIVKMSKKNQYSDIMNISKAAKDEARATKVEDSEYDLGKEWAKKFNPHYKEV